MIAEIEDKITFSLARIVLLLLLLSFRRVISPTQDDSIHVIVEDSR